MFIAVCFLSCKEDKRKEYATKIVNEWTGKEIKFPENIPCYVSGQEAIPEFCDDCFQKDYKILLFVDSTGCSNCRLKLFEWKQLIEETDRLFPGKVGYLFFFQPKDFSDIDFLFVRDRFDYPVFIDFDKKIDQLNQFPQEPIFQCFLLSSDNKVLSIGHPLMNLKIWDLFKYHISEGKKTEPTIITSAMIDKVEHDFGTIRKGNAYPATFTMTNTGNKPLIINRVFTSCGCTNVTWNKQPIEAGKTVSIHVELTPDEVGVLRKTITVYSNSNESPTRLALFGTVIE